MAATNLWTYRDAIDHLLDFTDSLPQEAVLNRVRSAVQTAYRDVTADRKWRYFQRHHRVMLEAPRSTGTMSYANSTRIVTLTGSTFPASAACWTLAVDGYTPLYKIASYTDATHVVLDATFNPGEDFTSKKYTLFRSLYPLPLDFRGIEEINDEQSMWREGFCESPHEIMVQERHAAYAASQFRWAIIGQPGSPGRMALWLYGYPQGAGSLDFLYHAAARKLVYDGLSLYSSQVSGYTLTFPLQAAGSEISTSTFAGMTFTADLIDSIVRFGRPGTADEPRGESSGNPYYTQLQVTEYDNTAKKLYMRGVLPTPAGTAKFVISDPIDLPEYLLEAMKVASEYHLLRKTDPAKSKLWDEFYRMARIRAREGDALEPLPRGPGSWYRWDSLVGTISRPWLTE